MSFWSNSKIRNQVAIRMAAAIVVPSIPILAWWREAKVEREKRTEEVRTRIRIPNVQTIDDLMIERCRPGDVLLFDRRWETCATGPFAALSCILARIFLCDDDATKSVEFGKFDHCGLVVPGYHKNVKDKYDPSNLLLLEATAGEGIVARPLLTRLEMSQSRTVLWLPLHIPGDNRNDPNFEPPPNHRRLLETIEKYLIEFRDKWISLSEEQKYVRSHTSLCIVGTIIHALGLADVTRTPVSPSAWVVVSALQSASVAMHVRDRTALVQRVDDFLRDHRFHQSIDETVRLRPGFKFLPPVVLRELSRS